MNFLGAVLLASALNVFVEINGLFMFSPVTR